MTMRKLFLGAGILFFFLTGCWATEQRQIVSNASPQAQLDPYTWDFGRIKEGRVVTHTFTLRNDSQKTLTIKDISTSCGCTASKVKNKILRPGESTAIEVKFKSKGYSGVVQQYVYVNTDDLDNPLVRFIIKAEVVK
ncbi:MAG: DUF1573 domain-containing protein [Candidatus Omnitrophica bacterium]|nr:DUF1573 domain-containing protein [Candidatus Omnitrophota bacterium]